jgi:hypothetical protein
MTWVVPLPLVDVAVAVDCGDWVTDPLLEPTLATEIGTFTDGATWMEPASAPACWPVVFDWLAVCDDPD